MPWEPFPLEGGITGGGQVLAVAQPLHSCQV